MTKNEAIKIAIEAKTKWGGGTSEGWLVNALEALGVLTFDEPEGLQQKLSRAFPTEFVSIPSKKLIERLAAVGLKIVESQS